MSERPSSGWLTPGVRGIGVASLLSDAGHEVPTSLLPSFLVSTLGAPAAALGLIEGIADGGAGLARLAGGALADDPHRRRTVAVGGYTVTALLSAAIGLATAVWQVGVLRLGAWAARGIRVASRNALLADAVTPTAYGRAFGFERMMDNLGAIVGPVVAATLVSAIGLRTAILVSVVPGLLAALAIVYAVRHIAAPRQAHHEAIRLRWREAAAGGLGRIFVGIGAFEVANVAATLLILRATELLVPTRGEQLATTIALLLYAGYNTAAASMSVPAGRQVDRRGGLIVLTAGVAGFGISYGLFALGSTNLVPLAGAFVLAGVGIACVETAEHAIIASRAVPAARGSAFGILAAIQSGGNLIASAAIGIVWTVVSPTVAFTVAAGAMGVALALLLTAPRPVRGTVR